LEEEQSLPSPDDMEAISSPSFSGWSSSDEDSNSNLEDDEDTATNKLEDSLHLEWWEEAEHKAEEKEDEMLNEQDAMPESLATTRKEERTLAAMPQAPRRPSRVLAYPQFPLKRFDEVAQIGKATVERRKTFKGEASCFLNGKGVAANVIIISLDIEE
jgi:hypothetical protein